MADDKTDYQMSFTTGGLFYRESIVLAELYLELNNWKLVAEQVLGTNLLQVRTQSSSKRITREVVQRLKLLNLNELQLLLGSEYLDQCYLIWLATCRRFRFIAEFAEDVIGESINNFKATLTYSDFDTFFNRKAEWNSDLDSLTIASRKKLRQVLFRILREANLLGKDGIIIKPTLSHALVDSIITNNPNELLYFPIGESDIKLLMK